VEFDEVVRTRHMVRSFTSAPVPNALLVELLDLARRAPSAGFTQGAEFLVLEGDQTATFWDSTLPGARRDGFQWPGLLAAPVLVIALSSRQAYLDRYSEPDKAASSLTGDPATWSVPYWDIDCAFAVMTLLLAAHERGLGALFFAIANRRDELLTRLDIPAGVSPIGAIALGWPAAGRPSSSARRPRRPIDDVVHWGQFGQRR